MQLGYPSEQKFAGLLFYLLRERGIHIWDNRSFVITTAHSEEDFSKLLAPFATACKWWMLAFYRLPQAPVRKYAELPQTAKKSLRRRNGEIAPVPG